MRRHFATLIAFSALSIFLIGLLLLRHDTLRGHLRPVYSLYGSPEPPKIHGERPQQHANADGNNLPSSPSQHESATIV